MGGRGKKPTKRVRGGVGVKNNKRSAWLLRIKGEEKKKEAFHIQ